MLENLLILCRLLLAQNEKQKAESYLGLAILALFSIVFIMDVFGKGSYGKNKDMKKILLFLSCLFIFIFIIIFISFKYQNS